MSNLRKFPARVVLTVTTGYLLTQGKGNRDNGIGDLYDILGHMTGESPFTHTLGRFAQECKPYLLEWFPEVAKCGLPENTAKLQELLNDAKVRRAPAEEAIKMWLKWMSEPGTCGLKAEYEIGQIPKAAHVEKDTVEELQGMLGKRGHDQKIIVAVV